ncbi:MAG: hypothetical protein WD067_05195 [Gaiellaceae bacterium]
MNRFFRRMARFGRRRGPTSARDRPEPAPQDVTSTRAKSTRHKKVTADRWNQ